MEKLYKIICLVALVLLVITLPAAAIPSVIGSGVSRMDSATHKLLESKDTWKKSESSQYMAAWIQIPPGSDVKWDKAGCTNAASGCTGSVQYYTQWRIFTPDGKDWLKEYKSDYWRALYDTDQGKIYLAHPKFFRAADGSDNSVLPDEYGGPYYAVSELISPSYQWQGKWKVETYIHDTLANPRTSTLVNTQYFTLADDSASTTTQTTTAPYIPGYVTTTTQTTTSPYPYVTTPQTTSSAGSWPAVVDYGIYSYDPVNKKVLEKKTVWTTADKGKSITIWVECPPLSTGDYRYRYEYEILNPDGSVFTSKHDVWFYPSTGKPAWPWTQTVEFMFTDPHQEGKYTVNLWQYDIDTKAERKIDTIYFTLGGSGTKPSTDGFKGYLEVEDYTSANVQKPGTEWDSTVEINPVWRKDDWSGRGDYYLSRGGDTLTLINTLPAPGELPQSFETSELLYYIWLRDWSDTNHAKGDRQVTIAIDGKTLGTFDAGTRFSQGTAPGYGWQKLGAMQLSKGDHKITIVKKETTSSAAVLDVFYFTTDPNSVPSGYFTHQTASTSTPSTPPPDTIPGGSTVNPPVIPVIPNPVVNSACTGTGTSVYAEDRTMQPGKTVTIPVMICNANDLANMDMTISYDTGVLSFTGATKGSLNSNSLFESNEPSKGTVKISFASGSGFSGSGSIALLTFNVVGSTGSASPIKISITTASTSSGQSLNIPVTNGNFVIGTPCNGCYTGGDQLSARDALAALQMSVGKRTMDLAMDVTGDGSVNSMDAQKILKMIVKKA